MGNQTSMDWFNSHVVFCGIRNPEKDENKQEEEVKEMAEKFEEKFRENFVSDNTEGKEEMEEEKDEQVEADFEPVIEQEEVVIESKPEQVEMANTETSIVVLKEENKEEVKEKITLEEVKNACREALEHWKEDAFNDEDFEKKIKKGIYKKKLRNIRNDYEASLNNYKLDNDLEIGFTEEDRKDFASMFNDVING